MMDDERRLDVGADSKVPTYLRTACNNLVVSRLICSTEVRLKARFAVKAQGVGAKRR